MTTSPQPDDRELRYEIADLYRDAHTPWPDMKVIDWPDIFADKVLQIIERRDEARERDLKKDYVKNESAEYHHQEMMRYKASLPSGIDRLLQQQPAGGIVDMYEFHRSMYEQLTNPPKSTKEGE